GGRTARGGGSGPGLDCRPTGRAGTSCPSPNCRGGGFGPEMTVSACITGGRARLAGGRLNLPEERHGVEARHGWSEVPAAPAAARRQAADDRSRSRRGEKRRGGRGARGRGAAWCRGALIRRKDAR